MRRLNDAHAYRNTSKDKLAIDKGDSESYKPTTDDDFQVEPFRDQAMLGGKTCRMQPLQGYQGKIDLGGYWEGESNGPWEDIIFLVLV